MIVVDASLAVKLVIRETDSDRAFHWYAKSGDDIIAPDLIAIEVAQAVVRRVNMRLLSLTEGRAVLQIWQAFFDDAITLSATSTGHLGVAAEIAMQIGHPVKDCIYLTLAMERGCDLVTCDAKFAAKARPIYPAVKLLSDYPS